MRGQAARLDPGCEPECPTNYAVHGSGRMRFFTAGVIVPFEAWHLRALSRDRVRRCALQPVPPRRTWLLSHAMPDIGRCYGGWQGFLTIFFRLLAPTKSTPKAVRRRLFYFHAPRDCHSQATPSEISAPVQDTASSSRSHSLSMNKALDQRNVRHSPKILQSMPVLFRSQRYFGAAVCLLSNIVHKSALGMATSAS